MTISICAGVITCPMALPSGDRNTLGRCKVKNNLYYYRADVVSVYDGDTITVDVDLGFYQWSKGIKLRLLGIDAPEMRRPTIYEGRASRDYLRELLAKADNKIIIQTDRTGFYKRWLADVWVVHAGEWLHVNTHLVRAGCAVETLR